MVEVSIIIPTYQSSKYVKAAIESVLAQTYREYEIIVVDGGSNDGTLELLKSYGNKIKIISQNGKGIANARNMGLLMSQGKYIAFLDSDDIWLPCKLKTQMAFFESKLPTVGLIYSDALFFNSDGIKTIRGRSFQENVPQRGQVTKYLTRRNFIPASTVIVRKSCFNEIGLFDESLFICEDIDMWLRISEKYDIEYQNDILAEIRLHAENITQSFDLHLKSLIMLRNKLMPFLLQETDPNKFYIRFYSPYLNISKKWLLAKNSKMAAKNLKRYINFYPYNLKAYVLLLISMLPTKLFNALIFRSLIPENLKATLTKIIT